MGIWLHIRITGKFLKTPDTQAHPQIPTSLVQGGTQALVIF